MEGDLPDAPRTVDHPWACHRVVAIGAGPSGSAAARLPGSPTTVRATAERRREDAAPGAPSRGSGA